MTEIKLKHVERFKDRHGKPRHYFRVGKGARVPLQGAPGSPEFMTSYHAALMGEVSPIALVASKQLSALGTFDRLLQDQLRLPGKRFELDTARVQTRHGKLGSR